MKLISWNVNGLRACLTHGFRFLHLQKSILRLMSPANDLTAITIFCR